MPRKVKLESQVVKRRERRGGGCEDQLKIVKVNSAREGVMIRLVIGSLSLKRGSHQHRRPSEEQREHRHTEMKGGRDQIRVFI